MAAEKSEPLCSHHVVNDDLTRAVDEFTSIIQQELAAYGE
jgi:guanylate kinase